MATWGGYDGNILATRFQKTFIKDYLDLSGRLDVRNYDVSLNNRLFVMNDASFAGNIYVGGNVIANIFVANNDVSLNKRLFVLNDASFMSNVYVDDIVTVNLNLISNGDASLNSNVLVGKDISCNGNVSIGRNLTINGNLAVQNYTSQNIINTTTTNYQLVVSEDLSLNGRLAVSNDVSMNGKLFVSRDISLNGNIRINGGSFLKDITINDIYIGSKNSIYNTVVGLYALRNNTTGINNTAVGYESLLDSTTGSNNTGCGMQTIRTGSNTAYNNTSIGFQAIANTTSGGNNTALGFSAGYIRVPLTTETNNTFIGENSSIKAVGYINSTAIGAEADIPGSNQIIFGRPEETVIIPRITRHLAPPIIIRKATTAQAIGAGTTILFPTSVYDNGYTGLGYNTATGYFTNNNSYAICLNISVSVNLPANTSGMRALYIQTDNNSTFTTGYTVAADGVVRHAIAFDRGISITCSQHLTTLLPLASGAAFYVQIWHNIGSTINITTDTTFTYPTMITIHVF